MIDFHCHLDLYQDPIAVLKETQQRCKFVLAVTTSPRAWIKTSQVFSHTSCVKTALGMHPEIVQQKIGERDLLMSSIAKARYIGEIGLDGSQRFKPTLDLQKEIFKDVIKESERCGGKIISIHSRGAVSTVLSAIEKEADKSKYVLHWFLGNIKELGHAIELKCWFSVNPMMFSSSKGAVLLKKMPISRVLPETDAPFTANNGSPYMPWETKLIVKKLAEIRHMEVSEVEQQMNTNLNDVIK